MAEDILIEKTTRFAVQITKTCKALRVEKRENVLSNQLLRSGTSIGANVCEAKYAQSNADFISKLQIALKECRETAYWLQILEESEYLSEEEYKTMQTNCSRIRRMLISAINSSKGKKD